MVGMEDKVVEEVKKVELVREEDSVEDMRYEAEETKMAVEKGLVVDMKEVVVMVVVRNKVEGVVEKVNILVGLMQHKIGIRSRVQMANRYGHFENQ